MQCELENAPLWIALQQLANESQASSIIDWFKVEPQRAQNLHLEACGLHLDYSKNKLSQPILNTLFDFAQQRKLPEAIQSLFAGDALNFTEQGPAHHPSSRDRKAYFGHKEHASLQSSHAQMEDWVNNFQSGHVRGATGRSLETIVCLGIGGSYWGPLLVFDALVGSPASHQLHFIANCCPTAMDRVLAQCDPERTLFIIASKSFSTTETLLNANIAKQWLQEKLKRKDVNQHFVGITAQSTLAFAWGISSANVFKLSPWVGGRYSLWTAMALPLVLKTGMQPFYALLEGAHAMDKHFAESPLHANMPVILGVLSVWYLNFCKASTYAIFPYPEPLQYIVPYLQQLTMESLGKCINKEGKKISQPTTPVVWGGLGILGQHSYYQALHQSHTLVPSDILLVASNDERTRFLNISGLAQSAALMKGELSSDPFRTVLGDQPSNTIVLQKLDAFELGALLALYEHKVFVHASLVGVNPFDQFGVAYGKRLALQLNENCNGSSIEEFDASTQHLRQLLALD